MPGAESETAIDLSGEEKEQESPDSGSNTDGGEEEEEDEVSLSIRRSRKRHLSPGVLRGDRIADQLILQEATASPLLKKNRPQEYNEKGTMAMTMKDFEAYMRRNGLDTVNDNLSGLKTEVAGVANSVRANTDKLSTHHDLITKNAEAIQEVRSELLRVKDGTVLRPSTDRSFDESGSLDRTPRVDESAYIAARKSLRLWPIQGGSSQDLWQSTGLFLRSTLGLKDFREDQIESISRPVFPSGLTTKNEAVVKFVNAEIRDTVLGASSRLSDKFDAAGKPTAGIRLEIPRSLSSIFRILEKYGQQIRQRHGQGTRRHVKFDDGSRSLYLNVKLPGDERWSRVEIEMARKGIRTRERLASEELERRLDIDGQAVEGTNRRSASTGGGGSAVHLAEAASTADVWTGRRRNE